MPRLSETYAVFLGAFAFFLATLHTALPWGDAPELITASRTLGVPHPPGYPLYVLLGHLATLLPLGSVPIRLHLLSALCASICLMVLKCSLDLLAPTASSSIRVARLVGVFMLATTPVFWNIARAAEVYSMLALLMAICFYFIVRAWVNRPVPSPCVWLIIGLALVHHYVIFPVLLWLALRYRKRSFVLLFLPLLLIVVPVIRSRAGVALDWYHPGSAHGLIQLLLGGEFARNLATGWVRFSVSPLRVLFGDVWDLFSQWSLFSPLIFVGIWRISIRCRRYALEYGVVLILYAGFYVLYLVGDREYFSLPFLIFSTPILCLGMEWCVAQFTPRMDSRGPILLSLLLILCPCWRARQVILARSDESEAFRYSADVLRVLPPQALLLVGLYEPSQDNEYFPLVYQQTVERRRPDVDVIGTGFLSLPWYTQQLAQRGIRPRLRGLPLGKYRTDRKWYEDVWTGIVLPLQEDRPICSTVSPAYVARKRGVSCWGKCEATLLLQGRSFAELSPYMPWGTVFLLRP